ncbi:MAG: ABC transporter ATP-binding protein [Deltaproteobacteria bacterium]
MSLLTIENLLVQTASRTLLDIPHIDIERNETLTIIGPNGAGKSTLLLYIACLIKAQQGNLFFHGKKVGHEIKDTDYRKRVTVIFQQPLLFDTSVFNNVAYGLKVRGAGKDEIKRKVMTYLEYFGIGELADRHAKRLSGGESQRVSLARAFAIEPELIMLDEPFSALDAPTSEAIITELKTIIRKTNTTAILVTHDKIEALQLSSRIVVLDMGKVAQIGTPEEILHSPANEFVANFSGIESVLRGTVRQAIDGLVTIDVGERFIEAVGNFQTGQKVIAFIRPENVVISLSNQSDNSSAKNHFPATVVDSTSLGYFYKLRINCGFMLNALVTNQTMKEMDLANNKNIFVSFKATGIHVITA